MAGKAKNKNQPAATIKHGKNSFTVGTKFEAKDSMGTWYGARVLKVDAAKKQLLVHFNGWSARYDVWLPPNSPRIRFPAPVPKNKEKEKEWRVGDRIIAKWGPAGRIYPATISKLVNESQVEVTFYDGFKKVVAKTSLKIDTEKLYRQYDSTTARKTIISPKSRQKEESAAQSTSTGGREKRKSHGPVTMSDYVLTDIHGKRRKSRSDVAEANKAKEPKSTIATSSKLSNKDESILEKPESPIPKKSKLSKDAKTISTATIIEKEKTNLKSGPEKLIDHCSIELSQQKNKTYVLFPKMEDDSEEATAVPKVEKVNNSKQKKSRKSSKVKLSDDETEKIKPVAEFPEKSNILVDEENEISSTHIKPELVNTNSGEIISDSISNGEVKISTTLTQDSKGSAVITTNKEEHSKVEKLDIMQTPIKSKTATDDKIPQNETIPVQIDEDEPLDKSKPVENEIIEITTTPEKLESVAKSTQNETKLSIEESAASPKSETLVNKSSEVTEAVMVLKTEKSKEEPNKTIPSQAPRETKTEESQVEIKSSKKKEEPQIEVKSSKRIRKMSAKLCDSKASMKVHKVKVPDFQQMIETKTGNLSTVKQEETKELKEKRERRKSGNKSIDQQETMSSTKKTKTDKSSSEKCKSDFKQIIERKMGISLPVKQGEIQDLKENSEHKKPGRKSSFDQHDINSSAKKTKTNKTAFEKVRLEFKDAVETKSETPLEVEPKEEKKKQEELQKSGTNSLVDQKSQISENGESLKHEETSKEDKEKRERRKSGNKSTDQQEISSSTKKTKNEKPISEKSNKNFEQKYEMFKQKWRAEKEKRRLLKDLRSEDDTSGQLTESPVSSVNFGSQNVLINKSQVSEQTSTTGIPVEVPTNIQRIDSCVEVKEVDEVTKQPTLSEQNVVTKPKRGRPKGKSKTKITSGDISRTPNAKDTISFASMVEDKRPSQKNQRAFVSQKQVAGKCTSQTSQQKDGAKWKVKPESLLYDNLIHRSYVGTNSASVTPSLTQKIAMKIHKKALHHQQKQQLNSSLNESTASENDKNEIDLTGITLSKSASPVKRQDKTITSKRKSLDFITGRLKFKKKMEALKAQQEESISNMQMHNAQVNVLPSLHIQSIAQPTLLARLVSPPVDRYISSPQVPPPIISQPVSHSQQPITLRHPLGCQCWDCFQSSRRIFSVSPSPTISLQSPPAGYPQPAGRTVMASGLLMGSSPAPLNVVPIVPQMKGPVPIMPKLSPSTPTTASAVIKQEPMMPKSDKIGDDDKPINTLTQQRKRKNTESGSKQPEEKKPKTELRRTRRDSEKHLKAVKSDSSIINEFQCTLPGCNKSFRKQHLLDYHLKYFHTAKPVIRRNRSSISVSSTDSNTNSALPSPVTMETSKSISNISINKLEESNCSSNASHDVDVLETSDSDESESDNEITTVDECVKCVCEDECELGFMIQCEQCFTWQHGECVGYLTQKNVPLFYLCHVCSNPKGLRPSCKFNNDYTWQRFGRIPPVNDVLNESKITDSALKETVTSIRHVDKEDEEILSSIMIASHAMVTDLYNIKDVLQNIRQKFVMLKNSSSEEEETESTLIEELDDKELEAFLLKIEENNKQQIKNKCEIKEEPIDKDSKEIDKNVENIGMKNSVDIKSECEDTEQGAGIEPKKDEDTPRTDQSKYLEESKLNENLDESQSNHCTPINDQSINNTTVTSDQSLTTTIVSDQSAVLTTTGDQPAISSTIVSDQSAKRTTIISGQMNTINSVVTNTITLAQRTVNNDPSTVLLASGHADSTTSTESKSVDVNTKSEQLDVTTISDNQSGANLTENNQSSHNAVVDNQSEANLITNIQPSENQITNGHSGIDSIPNGQSNENTAANDQSETETETADEQMEMDICDEVSKTPDKVKNEDIRDANMRPFSMLEELPRLPMDKLNRQSIVARYELFVEIERIENEVEKRLNDLEKNLDLLEKEYDNIDRSKEVLESFKEKFKLPDMNSLAKFLHRIKWTSIMNDK